MYIGSDYRKIMIMLSHIPWAVVAKQKYQLLNQLNRLGLLPCVITNP